MMSSSHLPSERSLKRKQVSKKKYIVLKYEYPNGNIMAYYGIHFMTWTILSAILCSLISLYVYANASDGDKVANHVMFAEHDKNDTIKNDQSILNSGRDEKPVEKKVLVELTDSIEEEDDNQYRYTPTVAPATPNYILVYSSIQLQGVIASVSVKDTPSSIFKQESNVMGRQHSVEDDIQKIGSSSSSVIASEQDATVSSKQSLSGSTDKEGGAPGKRSSEIKEEISSQSDINESKGLEEGPGNTVAEQKVDQNKYGEEIRENENQENVVESSMVKDDAIPPLQDVTYPKPTLPTPVGTEPTPVGTDPPSQDRIPTTAILTPSTTPSPVTTPSTTTTTTTGTTTAQEDVPKNKEMLSFSEWQMKRDLEKELQKVEEGIIDTKILDTTSNRTAPKQKKKGAVVVNNANKKNYASPDCGAKVLEANGEASNSMSILKEDKDAYMLNPCNVQAWVVVELCERIQIDSIDFANFEMFSSTPELMVLYVSNRFPAREWEKVGEFTGKPEKDVQTFHLSEKYYAKYVKLEVKKYFGKEHYCPVSLLRVFGITEVEEFDNLDEDGETHSDETTESTTLTAENKPGRTDENSGIFQSAKDAVVEIVHNVAKKFTKNQENESGDINQNTINTSGTPPNIVTQLSEKEFENFDHDDFIMKCVEQSSYKEYNSTINPFCYLGLTYVIRKRMCPTLSLYYTSLNNSFKNIYKKKKKKSLVEDAQHDSSSETSISSQETFSVRPIPVPPIIEITTDTEVITADINVKQEKLPRKNEESSHNGEELARKPFTISTADSTTSTVVTESTSKVETPSIAKTSENDDNHDVVITTPETLSSASSETTCSTKNPPSVDVKRILNMQTSFSEPTSSTTSLSSSSSTEVLKEIVKQTIVSPSSTTPSSSRSPSSQPNLVGKGEESIDVLEFNTNITENKVITAEKATKGDKSESPIIPSSGTPKTLPVVAKEAEKALGNSEEVLVKEEESKSSSKNVPEETGTNSSIPEVPETSTGTSRQTSNLLKDPVPSASISATDPVIPGASVMLTSPGADTLIPPEPTTPTTQKQEVSATQESVSLNDRTKTISKGQAGGIPGSKESIIVKLNAKMKALQSNLTMSMMYLEEMSEKYRTAVEKVDKRHERKTFELNVSLKTQQDLLQLQANLIADLTRTVVNLTEKLENITKVTQEQHDLITEKHVVWVVIEILLIVFFMTCCRRSTAHRTSFVVSHQVEELNRRKSEPALSHTEQCGVIVNNKRSHSIDDTSLFSIKQNNRHPKTGDDHELDICKRKKRKKLTPPRAGAGVLVMTSNHLSSSTSQQKQQQQQQQQQQHQKQQQISAIRETILSKTAGLLFYAGKGFLSGITGALYYSRSNKENIPMKPSRRADALIDPLHKTLPKKNQQKIMRRAKSFDLPPVVEEMSTLERFQHSTPKHNSAKPERPKSAEAIMCQVNKKHRNKVSKLPGRFI